MVHEANLNNLKDLKVIAEVFGIEVGGGVWGVRFITKLYPHPSPLP